MPKSYKVAFSTPLHEHQQEVYDFMTKPSERGKARFFINIWGRQSGKSYNNKYITLELSNNQSKHGWWIFPTYKSAKKHWKELLTMIESSGLPVKKLNQSDFEIDFYGGGSLVVKSADSKDNLRGDSLDYVILDEAAFYRDGKEIWERIIMPMLTTTRGIMLMTTTPNGRNWVYDLYKRGLDKKDSYYMSKHLPATESPVQDKEFLQYLKTTVTKYTWEQEYLAKFLVDGGGVFAGVKSAAVSKFLDRPEDGHNYILGVDFGQSNDATCLTVIDKYERRQVWGKSVHNIGTMETVKEILIAMREWQPDVSVFEKNGLGESIYEIIQDIVDPSIKSDASQILRERLGGDLEWLDSIGYHRTKAIHMDNDKKRKLVERLAADIEYGRLQILDDTSDYGETQIAEMSTYEQKRTASGLRITYEASAGNHDDTVAALYICYSEVPKVKFRMDWKKKADVAYNPFKKRNTRPAKHRMRGSKYASSN